MPLLYSDGLDGFAFGIAAGTVAGLTCGWSTCAALPRREHGPAHRERHRADRPAAAVILVGRAVLGTNDDSAGRLVAEIAVYVALVATTTWISQKPLLREAIGYVRQRARTSVDQTDPATRLA